MRRKALSIATLIVVCGLAVATWTPHVHGQGGQAQLGTLPDVTGTGATVALTSNASLAVRWVQIVTPVGNAAVVRWGDSNVSVSRGAMIPPGYGQFVPPLPQNQNAPQQNTFLLSRVYVYIANGDTISVTYLQ
jgi:hypothetical protein